MIEEFEQGSTEEAPEGAPEEARPDQDDVQDVPSEQEEQESGSGGDEEQQGA